MNIDPLIYHEIWLIKILWLIIQTLTYTYMPSCSQSLSLIFYFYIHSILFIVLDRNGHKFMCGMVVGMACNWILLKEYYFITFNVTNLYIRSLYLTNISIVVIQSKHIALHYLVVYGHFTIRAILILMPTMITLSFI